MYRLEAWVAIYTSDDMVGSGYRRTARGVHDRAFQLVHLGTYL
jgi:hypothetical protein